MPDEPVRTPEAEPGSEHEQTDRGTPPVSPAAEQLPHPEEPSPVNRDQDDR